jgi:hypothetical protein
MRRLPLIAICALGLLLPLGTLADEPKDKKSDEIPALKELSAKGVKFVENGKVTAPTVVKSAKELANVMADKDEQKRVEKEVNWDKQYLLVFSWGGSGGDKLSSDVKGKEALFTYKPGLTRDFRMHMRLYAVRTGVDWKFVK